MDITMLEVQIASTLLAHGITKVNTYDEMVGYEKAFEEFDLIFRAYDDPEYYAEVVSCYGDINDVMSALRRAKEIILEKGNVSKRYFKVCKKRHYHWCLEVTCDGQKLPVQGAFKSTKLLFGYLSHLIWLECRVSNLKIST